MGEHEAIRTPQRQGQNAGEEGCLEVLVLFYKEGKGRLESLW